MRASRTIQPLSYDMRLPDAAQAAAMRLLDASREFIDATVVALWDRLDDFSKRETMAASRARRIGCASMRRDAAAILPSALQIWQEAGPPHGPSRK